MINSNVEEILNLFPRLEDRLSALTEDELSIVLETALDIVKTRTQDGFDYLYHPFADYSESYAEVRRKLGLSTKPDLTRSGDMLKSLTGVVIDNGIELYAELPAPFHNEGTSVMPMRRFLDLAESDKESLESLIVELMANGLP